MIFRLDRSGASISGSEDLKRFHCEVALADRAAAAHLLAPYGEFDGDGHAWIRVDAIVALSGAPDLGERMAPTVAYARQHGWVRDEPLRLRGHVEWKQVADRA